MREDEAVCGGEFLEQYAHAREFSYDSTRRRGNIQFEDKPNG